MTRENRKQTGRDAERTARQAAFLRRQHRLFKMVSVGVVDDPVNRAYDILSTAALIANLTAAVLNTFENLRMQYGGLFLAIETVTVFFFAVDYVLRIMTAGALYPDRSQGQAIFSYVTSAAGLIDMMSFLPYALPFFFPAGMAAFRMFRVIRILRLFRINAYYDSLNVITEVISSKKQQLLSSVFIILTLMLASSLCMYSLEHDAQPDVFVNAFSGIWWSVSTLLTVGYGDIYPVTTMGKIFSIIITFLGVGMVAIPTGIISAGFVEQYTRLQKLGDYAAAEDLRFIHVKLQRRDKWNGKTINDLGLPRESILAAVQRGPEMIVPHGDTILQPGDLLVIGARPRAGDRLLKVTELVLNKHNRWNGRRIGDLNISRQTYVIMIKRGRETIIPKGDTVLLEGDRVYLFDRSQAENPGETPPTRLG